MLAVRLAMAGILSASSCGVCFNPKKIFIRSTVVNLHSKLNLNFKPDKQSRIKCRAGASQDLPAEIEDDPKFVPLNDEDPSYGPSAMLLVGFDKHEIPKIQEYLKGMGADFVKVVVCENKMLKQTLWSCMHSEEQDIQQVECPHGLPRICFMSGLTGEEIMTVVQTFPDIGLEDNAFAALVPKNAQTPVEEVIEEVNGDHERLTRSQP